jgi:hypothetical protein
MNPLGLLVGSFDWREASLWVFPFFRHAAFVPVDGIEPANTDGRLYFAGFLSQ